MSTSATQLDFYEESYGTVFRDCDQTPRIKHGYSPRHERRRSKTGSDGAGAHRRRNKRSGL